MSDLVLNTADAALGERHVHVTVTLCDINGTAVVTEVDDADVVTSWTGHTDPHGHLVIDLTPNADIDTPNTHYLVELKAGKTVLWSDVITKGASSERLFEADRPTAPEDLPTGFRFGDEVNVNFAGVADGDVPVYDLDTNTWLPGAGGGGGAPSGPAGGVLGGTYPNPSFAVDMATQAELDAEAVLARNADNLTSGTVNAARLPSSMATDAEVTAAVAAEAALARNADNLSSGTVADARIASTIARDSEVTSAISTHAAATDPHGDRAYADSLVSGAGAIASTIYNPASTTTYSVASSTLGDLDAANLSITFTVPPSGAVVIALEGRYSTSVQMDTWWGLREASAQVGGLWQVCLGLNLAGAYLTATGSILVTGLTPGASKTYKWAAKNSVGTFSMRAGQSAGSEGQMTMRAFRA